VLSRPHWLKTSHQAQSPWGELAKEHLETLIKDQEIKLQTIGQDNYGRDLGYIFVGKQNINEQMVKDGYAFAYDSYSQEFAKDELYAKENCLGFWCKSNKPTKPWEYRHHKKSS